MAPQHHAGRRKHGFRANYPEFVAKYGAADEADKAMARLFGTAWDKSKEQVWQWFDTDYPAERSRQ